MPGDGPVLTFTADMFAVHQVFRDAFAAAPGFIGDVEPGDTTRSAIVGSYYQNVLRFLAVHHKGEDELVTPRLVERCSPESVAVVEELAAQHEPVEVLLGSTERAVDSWAIGADGAAAADAVAALVGLGDVLSPHLEAEEQGLLPLAEAHLSAEEWGELPPHGLKNFTGDNTWLIIGLIRENMNDEQRARMLEHAPPPVAEAWLNEGEAAYRSFVGELRTP